MFVRRRAEGGIDWTSVGCSALRVDEGRWWWREMMVNFSSIFLQFPRKQKTIVEEQLEKVQQNEEGDCGGCVGLGEARINLNTLRNWYWVSSEPAGFSAYLPLIHDDEGRTECRLLGAVRGTQLLVEGNLEIHLVFQGSFCKGQRKHFERLEHQRIVEEGREFNDLPVI